MRPGRIRGRGREDAVLRAGHEGLGQVGIGGLGRGGFARGRQG